jgi:hypothetical protein
MSEEERLRAEMKGAHQNRAMIYAHIYDALVARLGAEEAEAVMKAAIFRRGLEIGQRFKPFAPADMEGLARAFLDFVPDRGALFRPELERCDAGGIDIYFNACPLKEAWLAAGYAPERIATLCRIAGVVDNGTFEGAGFAFHAETWQPGEPGCCHLHIRLRPGPPR